MASGLLWLLGAGAGLLLLTSKKKKKGTSSSAPASGTTPAGLPPDGVFDQSCFVGVPPNLQAQYAAVAGQAQTLPLEQLRMYSQLARDSGYGALADCIDDVIRKRGGDPKAPSQAPAVPGIPGITPAGFPTVPGVPTPQPPPAVPTPSPPSTPGLPSTPAARPPTVLTIQYGHIPYAISEYYTGQGARFREMEPYNPQLGQFVGGSQPYPGWVIGAKVTIPPEWEPWTKPLPPPLQTSSPTPTPTPQQPPSTGNAAVDSAIGAITGALGGSPAAGGSTPTPSGQPSGGSSAGNTATAIGQGLANALGSLI